MTISGGPAPVRAYIEDLLPDVLEGRIDLAACLIEPRILMECPMATAK